MVVMTPSTIMPLPTCDNYKATKLHFRAYLTHRDLDPWPFDPEI